MISADSLPIVLVSAVDKQTAENFITDVVAESESHVLEEGGCVWSIQNKYYMADVRMVPHGDGDPVACDPSLIEAHLIYLTKDECADSAAWSLRATAAAAALGGAEVEVCVCACAGTPPPCASLVHYEPVALEHCAGDEDEEGGVWRVRDALHAHTWRNLRRRDVEVEGQAQTHTQEDWSAEGVERWAGVLEAAAAAARLSPASRRLRAASLLPTLQAALQAALDDDT